MDNWFKDQRDQLYPGETLARVTAVDRDRYIIRNEHGELPAELTGKFLHLADSSTDLPCVGDWVCVQYLDGGTHASIHHVLPRRSFLKRKIAGKNVDFQMIAANVDVAFIAQSCHFDFNIRRLERYLVMVTEGHIEPVLLLTKTDLISAEELDDLIGRIRQAGINARIISLSNVTGDGIEHIRASMISGKTYCLLGSSGVGKTTLINRLMGEAGLNTELETGAVSGTGEGRHTTTRRQLLMLSEGAALIDMPGMRELGMLGFSEGIDNSFAEIGELAKSCRFNNCGHANEPGCAVRAAIERHELDEGQFQNYVKLAKESEFHEMSYADKRKKDRAFGKFVNSAMKAKNKRDRHDL